MHCEGKLKLRSHNTSYSLKAVVTKAGLTVVSFNKLALIGKINQLEVRQTYDVTHKKNNNVSFEGLEIQYH